ncbi:MAG: 3-phenylpropionate/trans-cinnamate dioxygenase ferredoxin reductase component, partial [Solirubrobacteraceae bacterium]|nr:3-phenylpropionate/trans-cinnamate dioxygenase ferredoxin reductase component [Solirubrobacteraceae bacterium]
MPDVDVLLIGGGVASAACATQLREDGFGGSVLLVGREPDQPYNRPPISKGYLLGQEDRDSVLVHPASWWAESDVQVKTRTSVMKLDAERRVATLSTKEEVSFDRALLATGANVRRLPVDGSDLEGIHYLRALRNADVLRDDVADAERVVLIGGSYIGTEVAASLTQLGKRCAIVMQEQVTLQTGFGQQAGRFFQGVLEAHGVEIHPGEQVARFEGTGERVERVVCESGLTIDCGAVVLGVGAVPDVMLARAAGLALGDRGGVRCDARLRTSADGIWAAGDICDYDSVIHGRSLRVEHWDVAIEQGKHVARAILGDDAPYAVVPYFFSDLADWASLEYVGPAARWDREVVRGSLEAGEFSVFYGDEGTVVAALSVGRSEDLDLARELIREHGSIDAL